MANPLFKNQLMTQFNQFKSNPMSFLLQRNVNIPQQYLNNPEEAVKYLMNNGQMTQDQYNRINQMAQSLGLKQEKITEFLKNSEKFGTYHKCAQWFVQKELLTGVVLDAASLTAKNQRQKGVLYVIYRKWRR